MKKSMKEDIYKIKLFNEKVNRLANSRFYKKYRDELPEVIVKWDSPRFTAEKNNTVIIEGKIKSCMPVLDQEEIEAFVLTYRILTQNNDQVSIGRLSKIFNREWIPKEAKDIFEDVRTKMNNFLKQAVSVNLGNRPFSLQTLIDIFIYGGLAHTNVRKEKIYRNWTTSGFSGLLWVEFVAAILEMMRYFLYFKGLNEAVLDYHEKAFSKSLKQT